jgi:hypothetical protein
MDKVFSCYKGPFGIMILFIILPCIFSNKIIDAIFPFYIFNMHDEPIVLNEIDLSKLKMEESIYREIRKGSLIHASGGILTSGILAFTPLWPCACLSLAYTGYNSYITHYAAHTENRLVYRQNDLKSNKKSNRFEKTWLEEIGSSPFPNIFYNSTFAAVCAIIPIFYILLKVNLDDKKKIVLCSVIIFAIAFFYSFLQLLKESNEINSIKRDEIRIAIKYKCNIKRMSWYIKFKKNAWSFLGVQADDDGYLVGDKECDALEIKLHRITETFIDVFLICCIRMVKSVVEEIKKDLSFLDKIIYLILFCILSLIVFLFVCENIGIKTINLISSYFTKSEVEIKDEKTICVLDLQL